MTIYFEDESNIELELGAAGPKALAEKVICGALDQLGCPYEAEISLLITTDDGIREMNKNFRDKDAVTDVLSFPMTDFPQEGDFSFLEEESSADYFNPESGELMLGDIVINAARVISQAEEYGHSRIREFAFLIVHSVLHLCGFDHMEPGQEERMRRRQDEILTQLGIER